MQATQQSVSAAEGGAGTMYIKLIALAVVIVYSSPAWTKCRMKQGKSTRCIFIASPPSENP